MTGKSQSGFEDPALDLMLRDAFTPASPLSPEFEDQVMDSLKTLEREKSRRRKTTRLMAVYWGITAAITSGLLANSSEPGQALAFSTTAAIAITVLTSLLAAWFITRQSNIQFLRLFARTLL